jgi:hypothetical protein
MQEKRKVILLFCKLNGLHGKHPLENQ